MLYLNISKTSVTDAGLAPLGSLTSLRFLDVRGSKVTEAGVDAFREILPGVSTKR